MKLFRLTLVVALLAFAKPWFSAAYAHDTLPATAVTEELNLILAKIQTKLGTGAVTEATLAPEIRELDTLLAKYQALKTHEAAHILVAKITLYLGILNNVEKALPLLRQLKEDFPDSDAAQDVDGMTDALAARTRTQASQEALVDQPAPPLRFDWSSEPGLKSLADLKGKVVVILFWATWSLPSERSFPAMREMVDRYRHQAVEVIGVTSLQGSVAGLETLPIDTKDQPEKEFGLMPAYLKAKTVTWPVVFCEENSFMHGFALQEIPSIAIVGPDGILRHVGLSSTTPLLELWQKIDALKK